MHEDHVLDGRLRRGMTFQQKVWAMTVRVPRGQVTTYGHIASKLGTRAYQAVGRALHDNPYSPRVPCHRVVASDGSLTGFASGMARKRAMLLGEGVTFKGQKVDRTAIMAL